MIRKLGNLSLVKNVNVENLFSMQFVSFVTFFQTYFLKPTK